MNNRKVITRKEAIQLKLMRYFTGIACKRCGTVCERYTKSGSCAECSRLYSKKRYKKMLELFKTAEESK